MVQFLIHFFLAAGVALFIAAALIAIVYVLRKAVQETIGRGLNL